MRFFLILSTLLAIVTSSFSQKEVTPQMLQKFNADIEKRIPSFKQSLSSLSLTPVEIEFSIDTFRIEQMQDERLEIDFSTFGMNAAFEERGVSYDKVMNKYYNKLLKILDAEDKKILVSTQKAWLAFRNAETKLIWTLTKEKYSGGGSMQTNIGTSLSAELVVKRANAIFRHYDNIAGGQ